MVYFSNENFIVTNTHLIQRKTQKIESDAIPDECYELDESFFQCTSTIELEQPYRHTGTVHPFEEYRNRIFNAKLNLACRSLIERNKTKGYVNESATV